MPIRHEIDKDNHRVLSVGWGTLSAEDLGAHRLLVTADPHFDASFDQLLDLELVTSVELSTQEIIRAARSPFFARGSKRAIVAKVDAVFGLCRMYIGYSQLEGQEVEVFRTREEALNWLNALTTA